MSGTFSIADVKSRMVKSIDSMKTEFSGLRTGRASASLLEPIMVDAYGSKMPLSQVATISVPEPRMISVQVWDQSMAQAVEKAIRTSTLGLNPVSEGAVIRVPLPDMNEERRRDITKVANQYAESGRIAVRHIRRDAMDSLKKQEKDGDISQDEMHGFIDAVQKATDNSVKEIDDLLAAKETEIMQV